MRYAVPFCLFCAIGRAFAGYFDLVRRCVPLSLPPSPTRGPARGVQGPSDVYTVSVHHDTGSFLSSQKQSAERGLVFDESVVMSSHEGQEFHCVVPARGRMPDRGGNEQHGKPKAVDAADALGPYRKRCLVRFRGQSADDEDATVVALGSYDPGGDEVLTAASGDVLYIQHFRGGSGGRSAQIRFLCHQGKGPQLVSAKEPDQHRYTLTVHAPALCNVGSRPDTYLRGMEVGNCLRFPAGWWTYEFCYKRLIRQFHEGESATEHILGRYRARYSNETLQFLPLQAALDRPQGKDAALTGDAGEDDPDPGHGRRVAVFAQRYANGSECDLTGEQREVSVRMVCRRGGKPQILSVQEHGTCRYRMVVGLPRLCAHPDFEDVEEGSSKASEEALTIDCVGHAQLASSFLSVGADGLLRDAQNRVVSLPDG